MTSQKFDQENVFNDQVGDDDDHLEAFEQVAAASPAQKKGKGKTVGGLGMGIWAMILGVLLFMGFFIYRAVSGGGSGSPEELADSSMSLEQPAQPEAAAPTDQVAPEPVAPEPAFVAPQIEQPVQMATPDVAATIQSPAPAPATQQVATDPLAAARQARLGSEPAVPAPAPTPVVVATPAVAAAPAVAPQVQAAPQTSATTNELAQLRAQVASLQSQMEELRNNQSRAGTSAPAPRQARSAAPKPRASASASSKPARTPAVAAAQPKSTGPVSGVSLRAVVGDSAWVQTTAGESIQVRSGDVIPGVGTVKGINAESAQVQLDDGRILK